MELKRGSGNPPNECRMTKDTKLNTIIEAIEEIRAGRVVIVEDDEDRENVFLLYIRKYIFIEY